jgi:alpha-tubulin suppressor-like RCC1 family protein
MARAPEAPETPGRENGACADIHPKDWLEILQIACGDNHCLAITGESDVFRCPHFPK